MTRNTKTAIAFLVVCIAWGASYFAIRVGLRSMPPLAMGTIRYGIAGSLLWAWCNFKGLERLTRRQWLVSALLGICFVVIGNGTVLWAEQTVPSGIAALMVAVTPIGTLLLEWGFRMRSRPTLMMGVGLLLGLLGVLMLSGGAIGIGQSPIPVIVLLLGTLGWSLGSVLSLRLERPLSPIRAIASQMLVGSVVLFVASLALGETRQFHWQKLDVSSGFALGYLILFASIAAYLAYGYLMVNVSPTAAGVCSYINPVVAMGLGACFGEPLGAREMVALATVLLGVGLISSEELRRAKALRNEPQAVSFRFTSIPKAMALRFRR